MHSFCLAGCVFDAFAEEGGLSSENWRRLVWAALSSIAGHELAIDDATVVAKVQAVPAGSFPISRERFVTGLSQHSLAAEAGLAPEHLGPLITELTKAGARHLRPQLASDLDSAQGQDAALCTDELHHLIIAASALSSQNEVVWLQELDKFKRDMKRLLGKLKRCCEDTDGREDTDVLLRELNGDSDSKCQQNWKKQVESYLGDLQAQKIDHLKDAEQRRLVNDKVDEISRVLAQQIGHLDNSFASPSCNSRAGASQPPSRAQLAFGSSNDGTPHADEALGSAFSTNGLPNDATRSSGGLRLDFDFFGFG